MLIVGSSAIGLASQSYSKRSKTGIANKADSLIAEQIKRRNRPIEQRFRALYRINRRPLARQLLESSSSTSRVLADLRWLLRRDIRERQILVNELEMVRQGIDMLNEPSPSPSKPPILTAPLASMSVVTPFGPQTSGLLRMTSRGVDLQTSAGESVVSPVDGTLVYIGPLGGHNIDGVVIETANSYWVVISGLHVDKLATYEPSEAPVSRGNRLGTTAREVLHLELRIVNDHGGVPIAPSFAQIAN